MKNKASKISIILGSILLSILMFGCGSKPNGDPTAFINSYLQEAKDSNLEAAYDKLAAKSKENYSKEEFILRNKLSFEVEPIKEMKTKKVSEGKNREIDGVKYKNFVEYDVTEKMMNLYDNKEETATSKKYVVEENGEWKVHKGINTKDGARIGIAKSYNSIGWMYMEGKGKDKNLNEAEAALNEGLKYDKDCSDLYYSLGACYYQLSRYDDSIKMINTYLEKETDNKAKSNGYHLLASNYLMNNSLDKAKEMINKSLELNPSNEAAKTFLASLE